MYPDAPLILNQRNEGGAAWFKSFEGNLGFFRSLTYYLLYFPINVKKFGVGLSPEFYDVYQDFVQLEAEKHGCKVLIWKAADGWEPLCKFLDKEAPKDEPLPWVNDSAAIRHEHRQEGSRRARHPVVGSLSWAAILGGAYAAWRYGPQLAGFASSRMGHMLGNAALFN
ncbi:hypothetical protein TOPH_08432 [Tolypocladium ophioglossoides CBS 100239]|uniref:Uncharacterized protein n=1 Tax=Tolypocladium ophioglossoides (strain CBS 100239) TaxID=1163406 RepID=A0A0L0MYJ2_TOLOC|nr:hypothetical protein TOPH_08432 [Tolypocladium ophioglossoides CBS 100239]